MNNFLASILALYDETTPLAEAYTIPAPWYLEPAIEQLERTSVFGNTWQAVGCTEQLANPGDYLTRDIAGEPILAVRGADSVLRAFYNVCRHHAAAAMPRAGAVHRLRHRGGQAATPAARALCDLPVVVRGDRKSVV